MSISITDPIKNYAQQYIKVVNTLVKQKYYPKHNLSITPKFYPKANFRLTVGAISDTERNLSELIRNVCTLPPEAARNYLSTPRQKIIYILF